MITFKILQELPATKTCNLKRSILLFQKPKQQLYCHQLQTQPQDLAAQQHLLVNIYLRLCDFIRQLDALNFWESIIDASTSVNLSVSLVSLTSQKQIIMHALIEHVSWSGSKIFFRYGKNKICIYSTKSQNMYLGQEALNRNNLFHISKILK